MACEGCNCKWEAVCANGSAAAMVVAYRTSSAADSKATVAARVEKVGSHDASHCSRAARLKDLPHTKLGPKHVRTHLTARFAHVRRERTGVHVRGRHVFTERAEESRDGLSMCESLEDAPAAHTGSV